MATQGQIRARAVAAVRKARATFRAADSQGEKVERELDRLIKRKTLISVQSLDTLAASIAEYARLSENVSLAFRDLYVVVLGTMQI